MEQSQQRHWLGLVSFIIPCLWLCSVEYPMPYVSCLVSCSVDWSSSWSVAYPDVFSFRSSACPDVLYLMHLSLSEDLDFCSLFYLGYICIALWDSLSGLCAFWDSSPSFPDPWLGNCILGWPVWPVIGYPLLGVHPSMSIVRLIVIGYSCNCLDGQLNYQASAHWLIGGTTMYQICDQWLCHSKMFNANSQIRNVHRQ